MRTIGALSAVIAVGLAVAGLSIAAGDRQTLVPGPAAVAESFARSLAERRYEVAARCLATALQTSTGAATLRAWFDPVAQRLGATNGVDSGLEWMDGDRAAAQASVDAERGTGLVRLRLVREQGLWVVSELPAVDVSARAP